MVPTSLPELPKPSRTPGKSQKPKFSNPKFDGKNKKNLISPIYSFWGDPPGEMDQDSSYEFSEEGPGRLPVASFQWLIFLMTPIIQC